MIPLILVMFRYFGGDIQIQSMDGHGTDAFVYLKTLETNARENLPIFNTSSVSKIKDVKNQVPDWTNVGQDWSIWIIYEIMFVIFLDVITFYEIMTISVQCIDILSDNHE